jgi:hypothetical protein
VPTSLRPCHFTRAIELEFRLIWIYQWEREREDEFYFQCLMATSTCQLIEHTSSSDWFLHLGTSVKPAKPNPRIIFPHLQTHTGTPSTACTSASIDKKPIFEPHPPLELTFASKLKAFPRFVGLVV